MRAYLVTVPAPAEDAATATLWEAGTSGIEVRPRGAKVELLAYFPTEPSPEDLRGLPPDARVEPAEIPQVDWVERFREGFRAVPVGRFLVVPAWDPRPDAGDVLRVDPGRAFGTGTHETTRLCLRALEDRAARQGRGPCLDLGSGTGLLAVAAARVGHSPVVAVDVDPDAVAASRHHARLNDVGVHVVRADGAACLRAGAFDLVLANLTAPLLVDRAPETVAVLAPGGQLVLSGLLAEDASAVAAAYSALGPPRVRDEGEWVALSFEAARR